ADVVVDKSLAALPVLRVPARGGEAVFREELPVRSLCELEAVLHSVLEEAVEATGRRRGLAPDEVLAEQETLLAKPEHEFVLQRAALVTMALRAVVEDEALVRTQDTPHLGGDVEEVAFVPGTVVALAVVVLRLTVV